MKRTISLILCLAITLSGCSRAQPSQSSHSQALPVESESAIKDSELSTSSITPGAEDSSSIPEPEQEVPEYASLEAQGLLDYVEEAVYTELVETLDPDQFYIQEVTTTYVSKEYLDEVAYNSQTNVFFGKSLEELEAEFQGKPYIFTLGTNGETVVQELETVEDDTYDKIITNVAIGSGVILVCVTVAIITKNPASAATAGKTVKMIFTASSLGAKAGTVMAIHSAGIGGTAGAIMEAMRTGDTEMIIKAGAEGASEGFKFGAIFGTVTGIANGIKIIGNSRFFPSGSEQALKYPEGVEFTTASNGSQYPRFEKWAKATATFDLPTAEAALNHTGLSGNYYWDAKLANAQCGFKQTPAGYVWHHVEDMKTMILIPQDLHSVAMGGMPHTGGASLIRAFLNLI